MSPDGQLSAAEFERAARSGVLAPALPYLEQGLLDLEQTALKRAFSQIAVKTLTPDMALATLMEIKSYRDLARKMRQSITMEIVDE